jgi:nicotinamide phosphoribosyltransferase
MSTSATTAKAYYDTFMKYANETSDTPELVKFQGHDFSFRGMFGLESAIISGFSHLCSGFVGTDTIPAVKFAEDYYNANSSNELVGCSVNATEHSVTCSWQNEGEIEFFKYLMNEVSPKGILSIVSDTWDFWKVVTEFLPELKETILLRDGKVVIRPDSGDPVNIICGKSLVENNTPEDKGLIECLWDIFGGTVNSKGYKVLHEKIGAIYGDILKAKGFASTNIVLGIGSYTYQYVTRDTHGTAIKATSVYRDNEWVPIYKNPKTDKSKKSLKGLLSVYEEKGKLKVKDNCSAEEERQGLLKTIYKDGKHLVETSLKEIRSIIDDYKIRN